ncbi:MAG: hypothetical protein QOI08_4058, partial [Actinomycetota bacterium]|nr:hypothetical protein [Actinomycetota bacterium]
MREHTRGWFLTAGVTVIGIATALIS